MPIAKKKDIPQEFLEQMRSNLSKTNNPIADESSQSTPIFQQPLTTVKNVAKEEKYADVINIRLSQGRRKEIKTFCSSCGISVTQYIETSFQFLSQEVAAGRISISKGGIKRISS